MIFILQILIYLVLFTAAVKAVAGNNPVGGCVFFYPKPVQQRVYALGLITPEIILKRKTKFFTALLTGVPVLPVIFIGVWNGITDFWTAYVQALVFLEIMNWYDGIVVDRIWVKYSKFWIIKGTEDLPYVKSIKFVVIERLIMTFVYIPVAAVVAEMAVFLGKVF